MSDMTQVIQPKSDQINADDLIGGPMTVTIASVKITPGTEQPIQMTLRETGKYYRPCKSMARVMVQAWGADASQYTGRSLTLYRDPKVKWGGMEVGGIRISHMSHIEREMVFMLTMSKANRAPTKVKPLAAQQRDQHQEPENALDLCRAAAGRGAEAFRAWWNTDEGRACRATANANLDDLKRIASEADAAAASTDDQPPI